MKIYSINLTLIREFSPYARAFRMMKEVEMENGCENLSMIIINDNPKNDMRRYNAPTCNEVAMVFQSDNGEPPLYRDIRIYPTSDVETRKLSILDSNCDPISVTIYES
jgi:hypothetical protein